MNSGLVLPTKEKKKEKKSKLMKKLTRSKSEKSQLQPQCAPGLAGLLDIMRIQMEVCNNLYCAYFSLASRH
jgi:hypothetical protein